MDLKGNYLNVMGLEVSPLGNEVIADANRRDMDEVCQYIKEHADAGNAVWVITPYQYKVG